MSKDPENYVYTLFMCLAEIEKVTANLYSRISKKVNDEYISNIFDFISFDSTKHYMIFKNYARSFGYKKGDIEKNCSYLLGEFYRMSISLVDEIYESIKNKRRIPLEMLIGIVNELVSYEGKIGEEYVTEIVTKLMIDIGNLDKGVKRVLELINEDENRHVSLLKEVLGYLGKKK